MPRVAVVTEIPTSYRSPLFERLARDVDLRIFYCSVGDPYRGGQGTTISNHEEVLPGIGIGGSAGGTRWKINPSVLRRLAAFAPHAVVIGGYAHPTMLAAVAWCRAHKVPYVLHSETTDIGERAPMRSVLKKLPVRWAVQGAGAFLCTSSAAREYLVRRGAHQDQTFILPNMPDVQAMAAAVGSIDVPPHPPTFLFVGRLIAVKGLEILLEAYQRLVQYRPQAQLILVGEGPLRDEIEARRKQHDLEGLQLRGFLTGAGLAAAYAEADWFVLPSISETFGVVILEAMAAGLPVIVSDRVGSAPDLVDPGVNGWIFPSGDSQALMVALREAIEATDYDLMSRAARAVAFKHDYGRGAEEMLAAIEKARGRQSSR